MLGFAVLGVLYVRFAGFAISHNGFTALFGRTAAAVNEELIAVTGTDLALAFVPETARASDPRHGAARASTPRLKPLATQP